MQPEIYNRLCDDVRLSLGSLETRHAEQDWIHLEWLTAHACGKGWTEGQVLEAVATLAATGVIAWDRGARQVRLTEAPAR